MLLPGDLDSDTGKTVQATQVNRGSHGGYHYIVYIYTFTDGTKRLVVQPVGTDGEAADTEAAAKAKQVADRLALLSELKEVNPDGSQETGRAVNPDGTDQ
jgi:hypothetical protein